MSRVFLFAALLVGGMLTSSSSFVAAQEREKSGVSDEEQDFLKSLPPVKKKEPPQPVPMKSNEAGEDIELGSTKKHPLASVAEKMRQAQTALSRGEASAATLQRDVLARLDALLAQADSQAGKSSTNSQEKSKPSDSAKSPEGKNAQGAGRPDSQPTGNSSDRLEKAGGSEDAALIGVERTMEEKWGHLPPRLRESMQNALSERFLPKYEKLIEAYYRRLAEPAERP